MEKYKVKYNIEGKHQEFETEAYEGYELAESHRQDIRSYEGITRAWLVPVTDTIRCSICSQDILIEHLNSHMKTHVKSR